MITGFKDPMLITTFFPYRSAHIQAEETEYVATEVPLTEDTSAKKPDLMKNDDPEKKLISTLTATFTKSLNYHKCVGRKRRSSYPTQTQCTVKLSMELPIPVRF